jgi:hypothetical protein
MAISKDFIFICRFTISSCLLLIATACCFGQASILTGTVKTEQGITIVSASIVAKQGSVIKAYDITNGIGKFELSLQINQDYIIEISSVGYKKLVTNFSAKNKTELKQYTLTLKNTIDDTVRIVAKRGVYERGDTIFYNTDVFKKNNENNLKDLLNNMPGLKVLPNGKVMTDDGMVSKVLIDGKDLTGENYEKVTNNLSPHNIDQVQVLKKYKDPYELSNSAVGNTEIAINITLKNKRIIPSAKLSTSIGLPIKYYEQKTDFLIITKAVTAINFINVNTIGNTAQLIASPNSLFGNIESPLFNKLGKGLPFQNNSNELFLRLTKNYYTFNNTKYFDNSSQFNLGKKITNRFSFNYAPEKIQQIETGYSKYSLGNQIFSETNSINNPYNNKKSISIKNELIYMIHKNEQLKIKFNALEEKQNSTDFSSVNNTTVTLKNYNKSSFFNTLANYTKFLKFGKIINIAAYYDNQKNNELLNNNGIVYTNTIINSVLGKTNSLTQYIKTNEQNFGAYIKFIKRKKDYSLTIQPTYNTINGKLLSTLAVTTTSNILFHNVDSFSNNFNYSQSKISIPVIYKIDKDNSYFSISLAPVIMHSQVHRNTETIHNFNADISCRLDLNNKRNIGFNASNGNDNTMLSKNFEQNLVTDNKNKFLPTNFLLTKQSYFLNIYSRVKSGVGSLYKSKFNYRLNASINEPNFLLNNVSNNFYTIQNYINSKVSNKNVGAWLGNRMSSNILKTWVENDFNFSFSKSTSSQNNILIVAETNQYQLESKISSKLVGMLNFQITNSFVYATNKSDRSNVSNKSITDYLAVDINLNYKKKKHIDIEARNYYFNTFAKRHQNILLLNLSYKQLFNKNKIRFTLDLRNITNRKAYSTQYISVNNFSENSVQLLPLIGLAKIEYLF